MKLKEIFEIQKLFHEPYFPPTFKDPLIYTDFKISFKNIDTDCATSMKHEILDSNEFA